MKNNDNNSDTEKIINKKVEILYCYEFLQKYEQKKFLDYFIFSLNNECFNEKNK